MIPIIVVTGFKKSYSSYFLSLDSEDSSKGGNESDDLAERSLARLTIDGNNGGGRNGTINNTKSPGRSNRFLKQRNDRLNQQQSNVVVESDSFNEFFGPSNPQKPQKISQTKRRRRYKRMAVDTGNPFDREESPCPSERMNAREDDVIHCLQRKCSVGGGGGSDSKYSMVNSNSPTCSTSSSSTIYCTLTHCHQHDYDGEAEEPGSSSAAISSSMVLHDHQLISSRFKHHKKILHHHRHHQNMVKPLASTIINVQSQQLVCVYF